MVRVLVLHNADFPSREDEGTGDGESLPPLSEIALNGDVAGAEVVQVAAQIGEALTASGDQVMVAPAQRTADVLRAVRTAAPDVVFNLCESMRRDTRFEPYVVWLVERMGIPCTGSSALALRTCLDKLACHSQLRRRGLPVPPTWAVRSASELPRDLPFPLIVKPIREDGSVGIESCSVVHDRPALESQVERLVSSLRQPALVQSYCGDREINVSILGDDPPRVLPLAEIDFSEMAPGLPRIVSYAAKWVPGSPEWRGTTVVNPRLDASLVKRIENVARATVRALHLRDYARVDVRLDARGNLWVIDVNPNCDLASDAGLARAAARSGLGYSELIGTILEGALRRGTRPAVGAPLAAGMVLARAVMGRRWRAVPAMN